MDYEALFDEYYEKVYIYIAHRVNNATDAQDLTADTFLKAFSKPYNPQLAKFSTYIYVIASNTLKDYYRSSARRAVIFTGTELDENLPGETNVLASLITSEEYIELRKALAALPERKYDVVYRRYYLEQSFREIGAALHMTEDGAKKLHRRALETLKKYFENSNIECPFL